MMGLWDSYWKWVFSDDETFYDVKRGIYYHGSGNTRSVKGMFRNWDLDEGDTSYLENKELMGLLQHLTKKGKISKDDMIEYRRLKKLE